MKKIGVFILLLMLAVQACSGAAAESSLQSISFVGDQTRDMSNFMNMSRYVVVGDELWGRSWTNDIFRGNLEYGSESVSLQDSKIVVENTVADYFCHDEEYVFCCIEKYGNEKEGIIGISMEDNSFNRLYEGKAAYLQVHNHSLFFTDSRHYLLEMPLTGGVPDCILEKPVYYPYFIGESLLLYQDDADDESLHLYDLITKEDKRLIHRHCYCYILLGNELYYCFSPDGNSLYRMGILNLKTGSFTELDYYCGNSFFIDDDGFHLADDSVMTPEEIKSHKGNIKGFDTTRLSYLYSNGKCYVRYGWKKESTVISRMEVYRFGNGSGGMTLKIR